MDILNSAFSAVADPLRRYGDITQREMVRRAIGGDFSYRVTVSATNEKQSEALRRKFREWPAFFLRDREWGWPASRVVQVELSYGWDVERWSFVDGVFANEVVYVWGSTPTAVRQSADVSIAKFGRFEQLVINSEADASSASADATNELSIRAASNPYRSGENAEYQRLASVSLVSMGELPLLARLVQHETVGVQLADAPSGRVDDLLRAIALDAGMVIGAFAENSEVLTQDHQLRGSNVWQRIEALVSRRSNGNRYTCRASNGVFHYELVSNDDPVTYLYTQGARRLGSSAYLTPREWRPGWYVNKATNLRTFEEEIVISADATIPQRRNTAVGDSTPMA